MAALWWKFSLGGTGSHLLRAKNLGAAGQEVWLDGTLLDAPEGTTTFTGPGAALMEFQASEAGWDLLVEGALAERYTPETAPLDSPAVVWWKFTQKGMGTHHVRVTNIGDTATQAVYLDGTPVDAPAGTMSFTGPGASLLELQRREGRWVLVVDGTVFHQHNSNMDQKGPLHVWNFPLAATGSHQLRVARLGGTGQEIFLDDVQIPAPDGTTTITGPGGVLLELQRRGEDWVLLADGALVEAGGGSAGPAEASWMFLAPQTGTMHQMRVANIGRTGQEVSIDGTVIPAPPGTTTFTGPGGALLEIRLGGQAWSLFVDGVSIEDYNARSNTYLTTGSASGEGRGAAAVDAGSLPQGVSYDADTGKYKANIKVMGRFKFLGDFDSPTEAHERYLKAKAENK